MKKAVLALAILLTACGGRGYLPPESPKWASFERCLRSCELHGKDSTAGYDSCRVPDRRDRSCDEWTGVSREELLNGAPE
jgi:hypothetical protein